MSPLNLPIVAQVLDYTCGAACFASLHTYLTGAALTEFHFAELLGAFELGFTPPEAVLRLANELGLKAKINRGATGEFLNTSFQADRVLVVTWWDEDAGHYSLVENLTEDTVTLMDPWLARTKKEYLVLSRSQFEPLWRQRGAVLIEIFGTP